MTAMPPTYVLISQYLTLLITFWFQNKANLVNFFEKSILPLELSSPPYLGAGSLSMGGIHFPILSRSGLPILGVVHFLILSRSQLPTLSGS